jgi:HSP20 family protein
MTRNQDLEDSIMKTMCCDERTAGTTTYASRACFTPRTDIAEFDDHFSIEVELPGVASDQVDLQVDGDTLTLTARRGVTETQEKAEGGEAPQEAAAAQQAQGVRPVRQLVRERRRGTYVRTFHLGTLVERTGIEGKLTDGILTIRLPKAVNALPRKITVA